MRRNSPRIALAGLLALWPAAAIADVFVAPGGAPGAEITRRLGLEVLIVERPTGGFTRVEQHFVRNEGRRVVWLRPVTFPPASTAPGTDAFPLLASATLDRPSHAEGLAPHRFGPSVLTLLARRLQGGVGRRRSLRPLAARGDPNARGRSGGGLLGRRLHVDGDG